jgi:hypothetical protein
MAAKSTRRGRHRHAQQQQQDGKVGCNVILSAAKNLGVIAEVLARQRDSSLRSE